MYYLNSRYYNPEWGRFINANAIAGKVGELLGHNMFAYCKNNPICLTDSSGYFPTLSELYQGNIDVVKAFIGSIEADAGVGAGLGVYKKLGLIEFGAIGYVDRYTVRFENGKLSDGATIAAEANVKIPGVAELGYERKGFCSYEDSIAPGNPLYAIGENKKTKWSGSNKPKAKVKDRLSGEEDAIKISCGDSIGVGISAHYEISLNLSKFIPEYKKILMRTWYGE